MRDTRTVQWEPRGEIPLGDPIIGHFRTTQQQTMKRLKLISTFIILTSLFACEPPVTFKEPQPTDIDNLSKFPKRLQGNYLNFANNSTKLFTQLALFNACQIF